MFVVGDGKSFPPKATGDARAEGFRCGFLGGETRGEEGVRVALLLAIGDFFLGVESVQKAVTVAFERAADAGHFNEVGADTEYDPAKDGFFEGIHECA